MDQHVPEYEEIRESVQYCVFRETFELAILARMRGSSVHSAIVIG
jgi:phosphate starvation-inducible protein PhoH